MRQSRAQAIFPPQHPPTPSFPLVARSPRRWYLSNYSATNCMLWGHKQGCAFVRSRCSDPVVHDSSAAASSASDCEGDSWWTNAPRQYLQDKCAAGDDPCSTTAGRGYTTSGATGPACDAQCYTPLDGRTDCSAGPPDAVEGSAAKNIAELAESYMQYILLGGVVVGGLIALGILKRCIPQHGSVAFTAMASTLICLFGIGIGGIGGYAYFVGIEMINAFVGQTSLLGMMALGVVLVVMPLLTFIGFCSKSRCIFYFVLLLQVRQRLHPTQCLCLLAPSAPAPLVRKAAYSNPLPSGTDCDAACTAGPGRFARVLGLHAERGCGRLRGHSRGRLHRWQI